MGFNFEEKDSCGVGFIASRGLPPTHGMTLKILECLSNLDHRGAKFADGTGDGAGVLTEIPYELINAELKERGITLNKEERIGIISCFLISFTISLDEFIIAFFLTGTDVTLPVYIWGQLRFPARLPSIMALGFLMVLLSLALLIVAEYFRRRSAEYAVSQNSSKTRYFS